MSRIKAAFRVDSPFKVVAVYALVGTAWVVGSGLLVAELTNDRDLGRGLEMAKGVFFVFTTAGLLYLPVRRLVARHAAIEEDLSVSRERLALALEAANQGLYDLNVQTGDAVVNDAYATMLGYDPASFHETNDAWRERLHPDDREKVYQVYTDYVAGKLDTYRVEFRQRTAGGDWCWLLSMGRIVSWDEQGRPLRMLGTHTDITARKGAEARHADALALVRAVLQSSPVGIVAYGPDGQAVVANRTAAEIVGTDVAGLLRQNFRRLESWQRSGLLASAERALGEDRPVTYRGRVLTTFGRLLWVQVQFAPFSYKDERHLLFLISDETESHQAQENLRLMETAVRAAPVGWMVTDAEGKIEWVNPGFSSLTGYTAAEAIGQNPRLLKSGRHRVDFYDSMWTTIKRGEVWSGEVCNRRKDGAQYQERMTIAPVRDEAGRIAHYVAIKQDVTAEKQLEQQLARAQRLESIGMLASGIAHDLNNIFTPILLSLELLKLKYPSPDSRQTLDLVENAGRRGAGIVRQLLTFARGIEGERTEVQVKYLAKEAAQILRETLPRNIEIESRVAPDLPPVSGDATQLHQVLLNLAVNARDAMPEGGQLRLHASLETVDEARAALNPPLKPGVYVALTVADSGTGISPGVLEHMFEPFYTTKPLGKGTGLGLSTVYGIVRGHGGAIEVQTTLGHGTSFTILLPALGPTQAKEISRPPFAGPIAGQGRRILIVDDEEPIRLIILRALQRHGYVVETAVDGLEGLEFFRAAPDRYAAIITDLMMPRMDGRELIREIRRLSPGVPIIASSGLVEENGQIGWRENLAALGVRIFLHKPYAEAELLAALRQEIEPRPGEDRQKNG